MLDNDKLNIIRLSRTNNIGPVTFFKLIELYGDAGGAINAITSDTSSNKKFNIPKISDIEKEVALLEKHNGQIVTYKDDNYPWMLKLIDDFPPVISVYGDVSQDIYKKNRLISLVGSRDCSILGKKFSEYLTQELIIRNFVTISGLANGIDESVHKATIKENARSIAIVGSGLKTCYPSLKLANEIIENNGLIISELSFDEPPKPQYFPRRNRIIAAMSVATIVIEADLKSGSMITANCANKYGRIVFAVPGFPLDHRSSGTNKLIQDGAIMVTKIDDIMNELHSGSFIDNQNLFVQSPEKLERKRDLNEIQQRIIQALNSKTSLDVNDLVSLMSEIKFSTILIAISELEIQNIVGRSPAGKIFLI